MEALSIHGPQSFAGQVYTYQAWPLNSPTRVTQLLHGGTSANVTGTVPMKQPPPPEGDGEGLPLGLGLVLGLGLIATLALGRRLIDTLALGLALGEGDVQMKA